MRETQNIRNACLLRSALTDAEKKLWYRLRDRRFYNLKFRRQYPIGPYIADFSCPEKHLIIELDGGQHASQGDYDENRMKFMQQQGFTTLRFWNNEVLTHTEAVLEMIANHCNIILPPVSTLLHVKEQEATIHD